jgi:hypothetical protein
VKAAGGNAIAVCVKHGIGGRGPIPGDDLQGFSSVQAESQVAQQVQEFGVDLVLFVCAVIPKDAVYVVQGRRKIRSGLPVDRLQGLSCVEVEKGEGSFTEVFQP